MIETVVGAIASPIFEQLLSMGGSVAKEIKTAKDDVSAINQRLEACRRYEQRYGDRTYDLFDLKRLIKLSANLAQSPGAWLSVRNGWSVSEVG